MKKKKRGSRKFRRFNIQVHLTNRWLYTFIALGILAIIGVGVWAATYAPSGAGHPYTEISTCGANKILKMNTAGDAWTCGDDLGGTETDPQVGAVTSGGWCVGDGSAVQCNQNAPSGGTADNAKACSADVTCETQSITSSSIYSSGNIQAAGNILYGYQIVITQGTAKCTAYCPSNMKVTGGGCSSLTLNHYLRYNRPSGDYAWYCESYPTSTSTVSCYAICARVGW